MVPMKDAKRANGTAGYQEAGCGTLTYYDAEGERLDTLYWGRMSQPHKAAPRFRGGRVEDDARRGAANEDLCVAHRLYPSMRDSLPDAGSREVGV